MTTPNPGTNFDMRRVKDVADCIKARLIDGECITMALTLWSGLKGFGQNMLGVREVPYGELGLPVSSGHAGILRFVPIGRCCVLVFDGCVSLHDGYSVQDVVLGVRAAAKAGAMTQIVTCAVGGVDPNLKPGQLVIIEDHINLTNISPLCGINNDAVGPRFPDMSSSPYDGILRSDALVLARRIPEISYLPEVVHAGVMGPACETKAYVRMLHNMGAQTMGMSSIVLEVEALVHMGVRVAGIACVSRHAAGVTYKPINDEEEVKKACAPVFSDFLRRLALMSFLSGLEIPT